MQTIALGNTKTNLTDFKCISTVYFQTFGIYHYTVYDYSTKSCHDFLFHCIFIVPCVQTGNYVLTNCYIDKSKILYKC